MRTLRASFAHMVPTTYMSTFSEYQSTFCHYHPLKLPSSKIPRDLAKVSGATNLETQATPCFEPRGLPSGGRESFDDSVKSRALLDMLRNGGVTVRLVLSSAWPHFVVCKLYSSVSPPLRRIDLQCTGVICSA